MGEHQNALSAFEKEYCPPIDPALLRAILGDYELDNARAVLDDLRAAADAEEASGFDPSGSSAIQDAANCLHGSQSQVDSGSGEPLNRSDSTELTSLTTSVKSLGLESYGSELSTPSLQEYDREFQQLAPEDKFAILTESFPGLTPFDIRHTLTRCSNNLERAVDHLLNANFLQHGYDSEGERRAVPKSIDGFAQTVAPRRRKRKAKGKGLRLDFTNSNSSSEANKPSISSQVPPTLNKWTTATEEIEFIVTRTKLSTKEVSSAYHLAGGSMKGTIASLGELDIAKSRTLAEDEDPIIQINTSELALEFPLIPQHNVRGIVRLTHPSTASAHDLAKAFVAKPLPLTYTESQTPITPQYSRPVLDDDDDSDSYTAKSKKKTPVTVKPTALDRKEALTRAADLREARAAIFAKASVAYRKSKSNPLMGGVAAYYADRGHEATAAADSLTQGAADSLVSQQSTQGQIDLHGIDVKNATRIASQKARSWWNSGQAEWAREGKIMGNSGFRIVTGVGRHSQGGKARLGPAVRKALVQEGWRVEEESGVLTVTGKARS